MKEIELYINQKLCDIGNTKDFSVYLKRQFLNPAELSAKDAQRSYDITLPASPTNNAIFGHINTEEVRDKFTTLYDAVLILGSIKIFEGKFKISEVTHKEYKGNLGIPYTKSIKEIFEDKKMNEVGEWLVPFTDSTSISKINRKDNPECFFPLALYGLLPKVPEKMEKDRGFYTGKNQIDETVRIGFDDLPASINCLEAIRKLFKSQGYNVNGSAFTDERLKRIYMSYRNPGGQQMGWPYGTLAKIGLKGSWTNAEINSDIELTDGLIEPCLFETNVSKSTSSDYNEDCYTCDMLNSANLRLNDGISDPGANISSYKTKFKYKINKGHIPNQEVEREYKNNTIIIPASGYYRVSLKGSLYIPDINEVKNSKGQYYNEFNTQDQNNDYLYILSSRSGYTSFLDYYRYELKLLRDRGTGDFGLENTAIDSVFFRNNLRQNLDDLNTNQGDAEGVNSVYFPYIDRTFVEKNKTYLPNQMMFVDPAQNPNLIVGLSWGTRNRYTPPFDEKDHNNDDRLQNSIWAQTLVAKSCYSWDYDAKDKPLSYTVANAPHGYMIYSPNATYIEEKEGNGGDPVTEEQVNKSSRIDTKDFYETSKYKMILKESPINYARRGNTDIMNSDLSAYKYIYYKPKSPNFNTGDGKINAVVWLEKGERITLVSSSDRCVYKGRRYLSGWCWHYMSFDLDITPFRTDKTWLKIDEYSGRGYQEMDWNDTPTDKRNQFLKDNIDLIKFLPSSQKVDEWLENFCKAFNLDITRIDKENFELNTKRSLNQQVSRIIDLDQKANVTINRQNNSFELPSVYEIGFTSDKDEQGYQESMMDKDGELIENKEGDDGGGRFTTTSVEDKKLSQTSNFSYNWMKEMEQRKPIKKPNGTMETDADIYYKTVSFPIISDKEPWDMMDNSDYGEMMQKDYIDKPLRFWYKSDKTYKAKINNKYEIDAGLVSNTYDGVQPMTLDYKNREDSILRNYFTLLTDAGNCFTTVDCYLTPEEYNNLGNSMVKFNGDLYFVAEVDGYDPLERKKATLKLIRKML